MTSAYVCEKRGWAARAGRSGRDLNLLLLEFTLGGLLTWRWR